MNDTQWPRFMVFQQEEPGKPLVHNGSVHAPDIEMALLNARDVFARRPEAVTMWVVPADLIYTKTKEELQQTDWHETAIRADGGPGPYTVFAKLHQGGQCNYVGEVEAQTSRDAMRKALETFENMDPLWWWVFPVGAVLASAPDEADPMFAPARDKTFKRQSEYPVVTMMRQIRSKGKLEG